jgi:hypothetical protein
LGANETMGVELMSPSWGPMSAAMRGSIEPLIYKAMETWEV